MGAISQPNRVLPLIAVFSQYPEAIQWAEETIARNWGPLYKKSIAFDFDNTNYYDPTMGPGLKKQFFTLTELMDPGTLIDWKVQSNAWEEEYAALANKPEPRPLNIDPGYIDLGKLVLASTKDYCHRLYLGKGIYAEITLQFRNGVWQSHQWTFPDYQRADYQLFFTDVRQYLHDQRRKLNVKSR